MANYKLFAKKTQNFFFGALGLCIYLTKTGKSFIIYFIRLNNYYRLKEKITMPFCTHCGTFVEDRDRFCPDCGNEVNVRRRSTSKVDEEQIIDPEQPVGENVVAPVGETVGEPNGGYTISPNAFDATPAQTAGQGSVQGAAGQATQARNVAVNAATNNAKPHPNGLAVFGFIMSLLGFFLIPLLPAFICNICAIVRAKKYGARRFGLAVTGIVFAGFWTFIYFIAFAAGF